MKPPRRALPLPAVDELPIAEYWLNRPALPQAISPNLLRSAPLFIQEKPL
jgi:hypothetical protein